MTFWLEFCDIHRQICVVPIYIVLQSQYEICGNVELAFKWHGIQRTFFCSPYKITKTQSRLCKVALCNGNSCMQWHIYPKIKLMHIYGICTMVSLNMKSKKHVLPSCVISSKRKFSDLEGHFTKYDYGRKVLFHEKTNFLI